MHLILTGATGLVGSAVLDAMIKTKDITKISIISRRPIKMAEDARDPRINVIIHKDFATYDDELLDKVADATGCVWALGISQSQVGKEEYVKITKTFALAAAEAFQKLPQTATSTAAPGADKQDKPPFNFVFVSGAGTTHAPTRFSPIFARVKGETELLLAAMRARNPSLHATSVRPGFVDFAAHDAIKPYIPAQGLAQGAAAAVLGPVIRGLVKSQWSPTGPLGVFLTEMAMGRWEGRMTGEGFEKVGDGGFVVVENVAIRRVMGLDGGKS